MNENLNPTISRAEFAAAIGEIERYDGMVFYPAGNRPVRGAFVELTETRDGQPAATYLVPGSQRLAMIVLDRITHLPRVLAWVPREQTSDMPPRRPRRQRRNPHRSPPSGEMRAAA